MSQKSHPEDPTLASTIAGLKDEEAHSPLWHDVKKFLAQRIEDHQKVLESSDDMSQIIRSQAIIANSRDVLDLPELFRMELSANTNQVEEEA
jgi:hypothetical protein